MNEDIRSFTGQQSQANQRNVDKDGIFLTENFGGLNAESSSMNMPLTDSAELMNVTVETSGKLRKRYGSVLINEGTIGRVDQHIPVKLLNGTIVHALLGSTDLKVINDALDTTNVLYAKTVFPTTTAYTNTSYATTSYDDFTFIHFARAGSPPIVLEICQVYASNSGTSLTIPRRFSGIDRDTSVVTNCKYLDVDNVWHSLTSINASTGAGVLSTTPASDGVGVFVFFHWHWVAQSLWRDRDHLQYTFVREFTTNASCSNELGSKFKQMTINQLSPATAYKFAQNSVPGGRTLGVSGTSIGFMSSRTSIQRAAPPTIFTANLSPQLNSTNVALTWWANSGVRPFLGRYSSTGGNVPSTDDSDYYADFPTHILWGGNYYTDSGYTVPLAPTQATVFNDVYIPFNGGDGSVQTQLAADTDRVNVSIFAGTFAWQTSGYYMRLDYNTSDVYGAYTTTAPNTSTLGQWLSGYIGSNMGLIGQSFRITKHDVPSGVLGASAVAGSNKVGIEKYDGRYYTQYGLIDYMNYKANAYADVIGTYQNRLCYAGLISNPGTLLFSNIGTNDETFFSTKKPHMNFEVNYSDPELATSPLTVQLNMDAGERIVCLQQWYDDLFVGTTSNIYRIHGGDNLAVTPSNVYVSKVANVGTIRNGMTLTEDGVFFIGEAGVYRIYLDVNTGSYRVSNVGLKIRPEIQKGMDRGRFANSVGRITYDNVKNVLYVLLGDEHGSMYPRRCFVYFADRDAWSEYSIYSGYMEARSVATVNGRVFMGLFTSGSTYTSLAEFEKEGYFTDLIKTVTLSDSTDSGYDLDVPIQTFARTDYVSGQDVVLTVSKLKMLPITDYATNVIVGDGTSTGVQGTDFWRRKNNQVQIEGSTFWTGSETAYIQSYQNESNPYVLNVYSVSDVGWLGTADLDYTTMMQVQAKVDSGYDGASAVLSLSYPTWWMSPAFTRNDLQDYKRMKHFYGVFENSSIVVNNAYDAPTWEADHKFNVSIVQNGTLAGQSTETQEFTVSDLTTNSPAWLDYYRVSLPIKGNFVSFQAGIHSFNRGTWEMVGYQIDTDKEGRTSRRAYDE